MTTSGGTWLHRFVPASRWLATYQRSDLTADLRAGATVTVLVVPQAMAYAALAGVPAVAGLYAAMVSLLVYALLGTSRYISVGPVAIDSLLTAAAVAPLADGDASTYVALTAALTMMVGALQLAAGALRVGALVSFVSVPVVAGFTAGAAVTIAATQLKDLLGLDDVPAATSFLDTIRGLLPQLDTIDVVTASLGVAGLLAIVSLRRWAPRVPGPLLVVAVLTLVVSTLDLAVATVGTVPGGFPLPRVPDVGAADLPALLPSAAAIALISYMESVSTGQTFARRARSRIDPDQELVAVGAANAAAGLLQGMPVAGGFTRGAVNVGAGARSQMSGVFTSLGIVVTLLLLTPLLALVPRLALAALILSALGSLLDLRGMRTIAHVRRSDLLALLATAAATLLLGPGPGLGVGVAVSFVLFLRHYHDPHVPELGLVPGDDVFRNVRRHRTRTDPTLLVVRVDAPMSFVSARQVADRLADLVEQRREVRHLVIDASAVNVIDFTGVETLGNLVEQLQTAGVEVHLAEVRGPVHDVLARVQWFRDLESAGRVHQNVHHAVEHLPVRLE